VPQDAPARADGRCALRTFSYPDFDGEPERVPAEFVSDGYFGVLGTTAAIGRTFLAEENQVPDAHLVVVLIRWRPTWAWLQSFCIDR
jgi:hypothetical protein